MDGRTDLLQFLVVLARIEMHAAVQGQGRSRVHAQPVVHDLAHGEDLQLGELLPQRQAVRVLEVLMVVRVSVRGEC